MFNKSPAPPSSEDLLGSMGGFLNSMSTKPPQVSNIVPKEQNKPITAEDVVRMIATMEPEKATEFVGRIQDRIGYNQYKHLIISYLDQGNYLANPALDILMVVLDAPQESEYALVTIMTEAVASQLKTNPELYTKIENINKKQLIQLLKDWDALVKNTYCKAYSHMYSVLTGSPESTFNIDEMEVEDGGQA